MRMRHGKELLKAFFKREKRLMGLVGPLLAGGRMAGVGRWRQQLNLCVVVIKPVFTEFVRIVHWRAFTRSRIFWAMPAAQHSPV